MKNLLNRIIILFFICSTFAKGQSLTLDECHELAKLNYPLIEQKELILQSKDFTIDNANSGFLPQLAMYGQATYQSEVTRLPSEIPSLKITPLSKDQYRIYGELTQSLYDGGFIHRSSKLIDLKAQVATQKLEVEIYKIKNRIDQLFFGVLLLDEQMKQTELLRNELLGSLERINASISNGIAFPMSAQILEVELLNIKLRQTESSALREAYLNMLGLFIQKEINPKETILIEPEVDMPVEYSFERQELKLFSLQRQRITKQFELVNSKNSPHFKLFFQGGYGRPALNLLDNNFAPYYLGGIRFSWNIAGFYNQKRNFQIQKLNSQMIDTKQSLFTFNQSLILKQQQSEVDKLESFFAIDEEVLALRTKISETAKVQLENGVISMNDYILIINAQDQARQNMSLHKIKLKMSKANIISTLGK